MVPNPPPWCARRPGTRADLKFGEYVFAVVQKGADGRLGAAHQVSKDGVRPPQ